MSISFFIKNKKSLLLKTKPMSVEQCMDIAPQMTQYTFDQDDPEFEQLCKQSIDNFELLHMAREQVSDRGFELSFDKNQNKYAVRVFTPSTRSDWKVALEYIKNLAQKMGSDIESEQGDKFTCQNIENFDYQSDIMAGLRAFSDGDAILFGIDKQVHLNKEIVNGFLQQENGIDLFSEFFHKIQYMDAYVAKQKIFKKSQDGKYLAVYTLTQGCRTILPYEPKLSYEYEDIDDKDIEIWKLSLVVVDGDPNDPKAYKSAGFVTYHDFIERLPRDKYQFVDAANIVVDALEKEEVLALLDS